MFESSSTGLSSNGNVSAGATQKMRELLASGHLCEKHAQEARETLAEAERLEREVAEVQRELAELERENAELERENAEAEKWARQEVDDEYWQLKRAAHVAEHGEGRIARNARIISGGTVDERGQFGVRPADPEKMRPVEFVYHPWIVRGRGNEIVGEEDVGKSTFSCYIAAGITERHAAGRVRGPAQGRAVPGDRRGRLEWHHASASAGGRC